jgi:predicted transcriptional regulator
MKQQREDLNMGTERVDDIHAFRDFLDEQLANGGVYLTPAQALDLWEIQNASEDEEHEVIEAIKRGFADIEAGRVKPAREALAELRRKHNLPELS